MSTKTYAVKVHTAPDATPKYMTGFMGLVDNVAEAATAVTAEEQANLVDIATEYEDTYPGSEARLVAIN